MTLYHNSFVPMPNYIKLKTILNRNHPKFYCLLFRKKQIAYNTVSGISESSFNQIDGNDKVTSKSTSKKFGGSTIEAGLSGTTFQNAQSTLQSRSAGDRNVSSSTIDKTSETQKEKPVSTFGRFNIGIGSGSKTFKEAEVMSAKDGPVNSMTKHNNDDNSEKANSTDQH